MPPKRLQKLQKQEINFSEESSIQQKKQFSKEFMCACGKFYSSKPAVYTHINKNHPQNERKQLRKQILDPTAERKTFQIRLEDINYDPTQSDLLCLSDLTFKSIFDAYKETYGSVEEVLLAIEEDSSDDSLELDDLIEQLSTEKQVKKEENSRQKAINEKISKFIENNHLEELEKEIQRWNFSQTFKFYLFKLNMIRQISKYFKVQFAALIAFSLQVIQVIKGSDSISEEKRTHFSKLLSKLWQKTPKIERQLYLYHEKWTEKMPIRPTFHPQL